MKPFKYGCVVGGENFCPRPSLEKQLQEFATDGQNLVIQGARRMGKTSLIKHAIGNMRRMRLVYIDLYYINSLADLCARVMKGIAKSSEEMSFLKKAAQFAFRLRPVLAIDPRDGSTTISVDARAAAEPDSLDAVMSTLEKIASDGKTCIVFDEFQDILKLDNANGILAQMRSTIQFQDKTPYFFTGSVRNDMMSIFDDMDSPFYKSALTFAVDEIDPAEFSAFIAARFKAGNRKISPSVIAKIIEFADGVSGDVQQLCEALWETTEPAAAVSSDDFDAALDLIFSRELRGYETIMERLTPSQTAVLRALADDPHAKVFSIDFTSRVNMPTSSVRRALTRLIDDRQIYLRKGEHKFSNPFFREWLRRA
ncbi:MAG: ATP-binding protein [bacterium]|nr:ATP-binding protein [bacterium]